ncbi:MAG: hypothetical protein A2Y97_03730 [Nitrospirae bacterium RBG_13_39_12]|nr:MAG: hypothetical protein A2Y97_03730 [Nitrospirae bacterium RBG_13_39_12]
MLSVAVAGTGGFAENHIKTWMKIDGVKIVAILGSDEERSRLLAKKFGIKTFYPDLSRFKAEVKELDILDVVNVPSSHVHIALRLMENYKAVFIEKPLDIDVKKALEFLDVVRNRNISVGVVSQLKFSNAYHRIKESVNGNEIGNIINFTINLSNLRGRDYYCCNGGWRDDRSISGGGVLMSQAIHKINFVMGILGYHVDTVFSFEGPSRYAKNVEEAISVVFKMMDGSTGFLHATSLCSAVSDYIIFEGANGIVAIDFKEWDVVKSDNKFSLSKLLKKICKIRYYKKDTEEVALYNQMNDFVDIVRNKGKGEQNIVEAINDIIIIKAIYESISRGHPIKVKDIIHE